MKVVVVNGFIDKESGKQRKRGEELEVSDFRAGLLVGKGYVKIQGEKKDAVPAKEKIEGKPKNEKHERK